MLTHEELTMILDLCEEGQRNRQSDFFAGVEGAGEAVDEGTQAIEAVEAALATLNEIANL